MKHLTVQDVFLILLSLFLASMVTEAFGLRAGLAWMGLHLMIYGTGMASITVVANIAALRKTTNEGKE